MPTKTRRRSRPYDISSSLDLAAELQPVDDRGAEILDVVEPCVNADPPRLGRAQAELQPERPRAGRHGLAGVPGCVLLAAEDADEIDRLVDLLQRLDARNTQHLVAVPRPDGDHAVTALEQVAHDAMARAIRLRRCPHERDRPRLAEDLRGRAVQSTARSHGLVSTIAISTTLVNAPVAMIVPGEASPAMAAAKASPTGISPNEPKKSRLTTRESR